MPIPPAAHYISCPLHQPPITTASTLIPAPTRWRCPGRGPAPPSCWWPCCWCPHRLAPCSTQQQRRGPSCINIQSSGTAVTRYPFPVNCNKYRRNMFLTTNYKDLEWIVIVAQSSKLMSHLSIMCSLELVFVVVLHLEWILDKLTSHPLDRVVPWYEQLGITKESMTAGG